MMGERMAMQDKLFYEFRLEEHVPAGYLLRIIDRFVDLSELRRHLAGFYSSTGRPSVDPELMIRMLMVGYCYGIRSERRLCEEVHLNLAYRWFCGLGLEGQVPEPFDLLEEPPRPFQRERCLPASLRDSRGAVHRGGPGGRGGFRGRRQPHRGRCQSSALHPRLGLEQAAGPRDGLPFRARVPGDPR